MIDAEKLMAEIQAEAIQAVPVDKAVAIYVVDAPCSCCSKRLLIQTSSGRLVISDLWAESVRLLAEELCPARKTPAPSAN